MTVPPVPDLRTWLRAIGTLTAAVNTETELPTMLDLVATTARELLGLDFCGVMVPAPENDHLLIHGASGLPAGYIARVNEHRRIRLDGPDAVGAPAARAFYSGRPCSVSDTDAEPNSSWSDVAREQGYRSILAVPLRTSAGTIGTLNSYRSTVHEFTPREVEHLELLAEHATIAITSARVLDDLRRQHRLIERAGQIHDRLVRAAVRAGGVEGIAGTLAELVSSPVVVLDADGEVLARVGTDADRAPADLPTAGTDPAPTERPLVRRHGQHVVADVVLDGRVVATVWLLGHAHRLDALGVRAAEHAAVQLSLEVLRRRTAAEAEQGVRGELLSELLAGADPRSARIRDRAQLLGHDLSGDCTIYVVRSDGAPDPSRPADRRAGADGAERVVPEAVRLTSHIRPRPLVSAVHGVVVALWPGEHSPDAERLLRRAVAAALPGAAVTVAVARSDRLGIAAAHRLASGTMAFALANGRGGGLVSTEDLGAAGLLLQFAEPSALRRYAARTLGPILDYDATHGTELVTTLRAHLDSDLDRRDTAERLVVHPNTVTQRLRRIELLTGLDVRSSRATLEARMALTLIDVAGAVER
ncbi:GAF domain-containing protein [Pseudonocardia nematodicida]|uniref:GAF domain-containing protein n=1 Tax=Pseudonocardia nematodicida TaxID=1206997 RepID=A0ABV1KH34_9PSEU